MKWKIVLKQRDHTLILVETPPGTISKGNYKNFEKNLINLGGCRNHNEWPGV